MNQAFMPEGEDGQHFEAFMAFERVEWREGHARIRVTLGRNTATARVSSMVA